MGWASELFGPELLRKTTRVNTEEALKGKKHVVVLFGNAWCPPVRGIVPLAAERYLEIKHSERKDDLEIIYVDGETDPASASHVAKFFEGHPWLAVPFIDSEKFMQLWEKFEVEVTPSMVRLNGRTGKSAGLDTGCSSFIEAQSGQELLLRWATPAKHLEIALRPMMRMILALATIEFGGVPVFLWLGMRRLLRAGYALVYATCLCVFVAKLWAIQRTSQDLEAFEKHWGQLKKSTFELPITKTDTGIPSFWFTLLRTLPQYTDNFTLCLAIGDVEALWGPPLHDRWVRSWARVPLMRTVAALINLAELLCILMIMGLVVHVYLFYKHLSRSQLGGAARVANLNLIADVVELAEGDLSAPAPQQASTPNVDAATRPATAEPPSAAPALEQGQENFQEGRGGEDLTPVSDLEQPLLPPEDRRGRPHFDPEPEPAEDDLRDIGMGLDEQASEARQLAALKSKFFAKVVCGCNIRFWFKISLQVLLYVTHTAISNAMWISILTGILHVALGTYPYVEKLFWARFVPRSRKVLRLVVVFAWLLPFWGSLVRLSGIFLCESMVLSFSAGGCEDEQTIGAH